LMYELPVVATDVGDVRELLTGIQPSEICGHDSEEIGEALARVLATGGRSNGRCRRGELDQSMAVERLLEVYRRHGFGSGIPIGCEG
jgi:teichuronic acid biosynthesis glycosyltransferase TuaC